jgi:hypothetical protein
VTELVRNVLSERSCSCAPAAYLVVREVDLGLLSFLLDDGLDEQARAADVKLVFEAKASGIGRVNDILRPAAIRSSRSRGNRSANRGLFNEGRLGSGCVPDDGRAVNGRLAKGGVPDGQKRVA